MLGTVLYKPGDIRFDEVAAPKIVKPTDVIIRIGATCVYGSDLWPYLGLQALAGPIPMGHEHCGIVEEVGSAVKSVKPGQFVIGSFLASDNTCPHCHAGYQTSCQHREFVGSAQAPFLRVPLANGTLVATPDIPPDDLVPNLLACSDVLGTGWFSAHANNVKPGATIEVVGDGAVGPRLALREANGSRADHCHEPSRNAPEIGPRVRRNRHRERTRRCRRRAHQGHDQQRLAADSVLECVGTDESMMQALHSTRPGGSIGYVGVPHGVEFDGQKLFFTYTHLHGGPACRFLPMLIGLMVERKIEPGKVFDLILPLSRVTEGCRAMHERRAIKTLLRP